MYYDDHAPPHFHASYEGKDCVFDIQRISLMEGNLSPRALGLIVEWATLHRQELLEAWERAQKREAPGKIEPLQ